jgi:hypothetical protein
MVKNSEDIKFTSFEQFQEYYKLKTGKSNSKEHNPYYQIGLEAAQLASESTLKTLNLGDKSRN